MRTSLPVCDPNNTPANSVPPCGVELIRSSTMARMAWSTDGVHSTTREFSWKREESPSSLEAVPAICASSSLVQSHGCKPAEHVLVDKLYDLVHFVAEARVPTRDTVVISSLLLLHRRPHDPVPPNSIPQRLCSHSFQFPRCIR